MLSIRSQPDSGGSDLKVGVFHPAFDLYGGAEFVALVVVNALAQCGHEVELFVNRKVDQEKTEQILGEQIASNVKVVVKPTVLEPRGTLDMYSRMLRSLVFESKCEILVDTYSNYVFPWTDVCYFHFPYLNRYNYNTRFPYLRSAHLNHVLNLPYVLFEKHFESYDAKLLLANSCFTAGVIRDFLGIDTEVIYPPVPSTFFSKDGASQGRDAREDLVVTVSRFDQGKGLEAVPRIASLTDRNIQFVIVGLVQDPSVLDSIRRSIDKLGLTDRVKTLTNVPRQDVRKILSKAKIYLHTTIREHFGISIVEGMAMGCLPLVHDSGGVREFVPKELRYESVSDAAQKIDKATSNWRPEESENMTGIAKRFSEENFAAEFLRAFKRFDEERPSRR